MYNDTSCEHSHKPQKNMWIRSPSWEYRGTVADITTARWLWNNLWVASTLEKQNKSLSDSRKKKKTPIMLIVQTCEYYAMLPYASNAFHSAQTFFVSNKQEGFLFLKKKILISVVFIVTKFRQNPTHRYFMPVSYYFLVFNLYFQRLKKLTLLPI